MTFKTTTLACLLLALTSVGYVVCSNVPIATAVGQALVLTIVLTYQAVGVVAFDVVRIRVIVIHTGIVFFCLSEVVVIVIALVVAILANLAQHGCQV